MAGTASPQSEPRRRGGWVSRRGECSLDSSLTARHAIWCEIEILTLLSADRRRDALHVAPCMMIARREAGNPEHVVRELSGAGGDTDLMRPLAASGASPPSRIRLTGKLAPALFCGS
jgi:hypothetical protein